MGVRERFEVEPTEADEDDAIGRGSAKVPVKPRGADEAEVDGMSDDEDETMGGRELAMRSISRLRSSLR